jgi:hypothetical protein
MKRLLLLEVTEKPSPPIPENDRSVKELELLRSNFYSLNLSVSLSLSPPFLPSFSSSILYLSLPSFILQEASYDAVGSTMAEVLLLAT